jgi:hypothetical protein
MTQDIDTQSLQGQCKKVRLQSKLIDEHRWKKAKDIVIKQESSNT